MRKLYFGILLLFSIILVSLSFIGGIGKNKEGLLSTGYSPIKCSTYSWVRAQNLDSSNNTNPSIPVEWLMLDLSGRLIMRNFYPPNIIPGCKNIVTKCNNYRYVSEPLFPPIPQKGTTPSTTFTSWIKTDLNGNIFSSGFQAPNGVIQGCDPIIDPSSIVIRDQSKNVIPVPTPIPAPIPFNNLPPWKIFSVGVLNETKQNINNMIEVQSDKLKNVVLK